MFISSSIALRTELHHSRSRLIGFAFDFKRRFTDHGGASGQHHLRPHDGIACLGGADAVESGDRRADVRAKSLRYILMCHYFCPIKIVTTERIEIAQRQRMERSKGLITLQCRSIALQSHFNAHCRQMQTRIATMPAIQPSMMSVFIVSLLSPRGRLQVVLRALRGRR